MASAAFAAVYCLVVLAALLGALAGCRAWLQYRRTLLDVLQRRRARDLESGRPNSRVETDDYWQGAPPPRLGDASVVVASPSLKLATPLLPTATHVQKSTFRTDL